MKRTVALLLLITMLLCAVSCGGGKPAVTTPAVTDPTITDAPVTDSPVTTEYPEMPEDMDFDGYEFVMLMSGLSVNDFNDFASDNAGFAVVNEAIFDRNSRVEDMFKCTITNVKELAASWGNGPGFKRMRDDYVAGESSYDICAVGTFDAPQVALNGYAYDLNEMPYIDLTRGWWDQQANKDLCVGGKMYYTTGDISIVDNLATHCILFSKSIAEEKQITDIYELVENKKWTYDKFEEYVRMVSNNLNGDDKMDENDRFGVLSWNDALQASLAGAKSKIAGVGEDGKIVLTMYSEKNIALVEQVTDLLFDTDYSYNYVNRTTSGRWQDKMAPMFADGKALFFTTMFSTVPLLRDSTMDFGIIPYPMFNEEQGEYGGYLAATYSVMYCVESFVEDEEITGAITEMLAYLSREIVTPAYYEQTLKGRDVRDDESKACLDIIFASRTFDLGIYYTIGDFTGKLTNMMKASKNDFVNIYQAGKRAAEVKIKTINTQFAENNGEEK